MPGKISMWIDNCISMIASLILLVILFQYNWYVFSCGLILWISLFFYLKERTVTRRKILQDYYKNIIRNINEYSNFALDNLPQVILIIDREGRMRWFNNQLPKWMNEEIDLDEPLFNVWPNIPQDKLWSKDGQMIFSQNNNFYLMIYKGVKSSSDLTENDLMTIYISDISEHERFKLDIAMRTTVFGYIQIDNYDDVMQGLSEAQRTSILFEVNNLLDKWCTNLGGLLKRVSEDLYIIVLERHSLDLAISEKFDILDKVRSLHGDNKFPITLSIACVQNREGLKMSDLGDLVEAHLDLVLGRGGDQVAVDLDGKIQFFGGKTKAVEKHTRVKARVVAHAVYERMNAADMIFVMGHHNEDFDSLGAAIGVVTMAKQLKKTVYLILSTMNEGVDKLINLCKNDESMKDLFITEKEALEKSAQKPLLFVVDTHIPHLVASQKLLESINDVIVIDHHRRSEHIIKNVLLLYIESYSSSTSELITELLMYFNETVKLTRLEATALYSGIVVDTKNFRVNTGVRTFDAVSFLRRCGGDPELVQYLFKTDYDTNLAEGIAIANSHLFSEGLLVTICPDTPNIQAVSGKIADDLLTIENVKVSVVLYQLKENLVGVSMRSTGEVNVQIIMEQFGGGGHQNVAGTQVNTEDIEELKNDIITTTLEYMKEVDLDESNPT